MSIAGFSWWQILLGGLLATFAICANTLALVIVGKVNEKLPESQRVSYIWWNAAILKRYRSLYPGGKLASLHKVCVIGMGVCFAAGAISILLRPHG